jgi:protein-tyrosine phosphatase
MAEGVLVHQAKQAGLDIEVDSAGTSNWHEGEQPDSRAIEKMREKGIDIFHQASRPFVVEDFDRFDQILVADRNNYHDVLTLKRSVEDHNKVEMILNLSEPETNRAVPDPYFGATDGFEIVYQLLDEACAALVKELQTAS